MDSITLWARNGEAVRQAIELGEIAHIETASEELTDEFRDCSRDPGFDMDRAGDHFYTTGPNHFFPREPTMFGPGAYVPDSTEGIVDVKDLPVPQLGLYSRNHKHTPCPRCGHLASRHTSDQRTLHDLGD